MALPYFTKQEIQMIRRCGECVGVCPHLLLRKPHTPSAAARSLALYGLGCIVQGDGSSLEINPDSNWPSRGIKDWPPPINSGHL